MISSGPNQPTCPWNTPVSLLSKEKREPGMAIVMVSSTNSEQNRRRKPPKDRRLGVVWPEIGWHYWLVDEPPPYSRRNWNWASRCTAKSTLLVTAALMGQHTPLGTPA